VKDWNNRTKEVAYLYNPAFCGKILHSAIKGYQHKKPSMPYSLIFFVLPIVFHPGIFKDISYSKRSLFSWFQKNPELLNNFYKRVIDFEEITKESLMFLANYDLIKINESELLIKEFTNRVRKPGDKELKQYFEKAEKVGHFLAQTGDPFNVFMVMGVTV
jgi:hypothetical protein